MRWCKLSWQESQHKLIQNWLTDLNTGVPGGHMNGWFCTLFPTYCASGRTGKEGNGNWSWKLQQLQADLRWLGAQALKPHLQAPSTYFTFLPSVPSSFWCSTSLYCSTACCFEHEGWSTGRSTICEHIQKFTFCQQLTTGADAHTLLCRKDAVSHKVYIHKEDPDRLKCVV